MGGLTLDGELLDQRRTDHAQLRHGLPGRLIASGLYLPQHVAQLALDIGEAHKRLAILLAQRGDFPPG